MKELKLPHAIVISTVLLVLGVLAWGGKDSGVVVAGLLAVLGALGLVAKQNAEVKEQNVAIKEQTNGTNKELLGIITRQHEDIVRLSHKMAEMQLPPKE